MRSLRDLRGRVIALNKLCTCPHGIVRTLLREAGMEERERRGARAPAVGAVVRPRGRRQGSLVAWLVMLLVGLRASGQAAQLTCPAGDAACLIEAVDTANGLGEPTTIELAPGIYALTSVDNETDGPNALPPVTGTLTIRGAGAQGTIVERAAGAPGFRLLRVAPTGALTLEGLTLRGGNADPGPGPLDGVCGGILSVGGTVILSHARLAANRAAGGFARGGGLFNDAGTVIVSSSTIADNVVEAFSGSGGGLGTRGGSVTITNSTIVGNLVSGRGAFGGGIDDAGVATPGAVTVGEIVNSTIAGNSAIGHAFGGGALSTGVQSRWTITSSTIAGNTALGFGGGGGGINAGGAVSLGNTILALNTGRDCAGPVTSLDHNLLGDLTGCPVTLGPHDRTGDPGLEAYTDDGVAGHGHLPLGPSSQAIDAGDDTACPPTDQLGRPRVGPCDIGAVERYSGPLAAFVTGLYANALGREPSAPELAAWLSFLQPDPTLARARLTVHAFFDGAEYRARPVTPWSHVTALYRAILGREPDPPGLEGWVRTLLDRLDSPVPLFVGSREFKRLVPDCRDPQTIAPLVTRLYERGLRRTPAPGEVAAWTDHAVATCDLEGVVVAFLDSPEYLGVPRTLADHVAVLYRALLAREPSAVEATRWLDDLARQRGEIEDRFVDSAEFRVRPLFR